MKTIKATVKMYTQARKYSFEDEFTIDTRAYKSETDATETVIDLHKQEVSFDVPDFSGVDFTNLEVDQLKEMKSKILAESQLKANVIDEKIQNLLSLTFTEKAQ